MSGRECTTGQDIEDFAHEMRRENQVISSVSNSESNKLIVELSNLDSGSIRTIKRDLKVLIENYGYKKMIRGCIQVKDTEKAIIFVQHIENHLKDTGKFVMCKICGKTIDEIYEEEGK